jgi:hypothetical protein
MLQPKKKSTNSEIKNSDIFYKEYLSSPKYKERLIKQKYNNPDKVINDRKSQSSKTKINEIPYLGQFTSKNTGSYFIPENNTIDYDAFDLKLYPGSNKEDIIVHERSHSAGALKYKKNNNLTLNENETKDINNKNKIKGDHEKNAWEAKADMDVLRYYLKKDNIYDTGTQDFTPELLNKSKNKYKDNTTIKRFLDRFSDKDAIYLMNNIAMNNEQKNEQVISAYGGEINTNMNRYAQGGDLTQFNTGGTHESSPIGGIPIGNNNFVEQGETKQDNFIYSNRIFLDENVISQYNLPKSLIGKSVADATKLIDNKFKGRNDKISQSTKNSMLSKIAEAQESMKPQEPEMEQSQEGDEQQLPEDMIDSNQMAWGGFTDSTIGQGFGEEATGAQKSAALSAGLGVATTTLDLGNVAFGKAAQDISGTAESGRVGGVGMIGGSAIKGASAGAAFGPLGAGIGAAVGGLAGLAGLGKARKAEALNTQRFAMNTNRSLSDNYSAMGGRIDPKKPTEQTVNTLQRGIDVAQLIGQKFFKKGPLSIVPGTVGSAFGVLDSFQNKRNINPADVIGLIPNPVTQILSETIDQGAREKRMTHEFAEKSRKINPKIELKETENTIKDTFGKRSYAEGGFIKQFAYDDKMNQMEDGGYYDKNNPYFMTNPGQIIPNNQQTVSSSQKVPFPKPPTADYDTNIIKNVHDAIGITPSMPGYGKEWGKKSNQAYYNSVINDKESMKNNPSFGKDFKTMTLTKNQMLQPNFPESAQKRFGLTKEGYKFTPETPIIPQREDPIITPTQTKAGFEAYYANAKQIEDTKKNRTLVGKGLSYANDNLGNLARYAPIAANALQLAQLKKPQGERLDRLGNRYKPEYVDEAQLQNIANQTMNNSVNAIGQSGASQGQLRSSIIGSQLQRTKALSDSYGQAAAQNRATNDRAQTFNLGVDSANLQQSNSEKDINARDQAAYRNAKREYITGIGEGIGDIGKEQTQKKIIAKTLGYKWDGEYVKSPDGTVVTDPDTGKPMTGEKLKELQSTKDKKALGGYLIKNKVK